MKRFLLIALLCLLLLSFASVVYAGEPKSSFVHFVVLPSIMPDGGSSMPACKAFEAEMIMLAGGFSSLGSSRGGSMHAEGVVPKDNYAYLVASSKDISAEIKKVVQRLFGIERVFILVWVGHMVR